MTILDEQARTEAAVFAKATEREARRLWHALRHGESTFGYEDMQALAQLDRLEIAAGLLADRLARLER